ncbi:MAG: class 1 fructose-bisphosphatase [Bacteroidetes bacterium]|nr:class 1 fructose-bisphosphatase [Bacteroidota bacterium]
MGNSRALTLEQFISDQQAIHKEATGAFSRIFRSLELGAKMVNRDVRKAGLIDILGNQGSTNVQGEEQKKLDVIADEIFIHNLSKSGEVCMVVSEEKDAPVFVEGSENAAYIICIDPLDGSSNIDVNASIGTIFSVFKRDNTNSAPTLNDCFRKGTEQVAAGYFIYGSSTMLVYTTGDGVNGFTLDDGIQEFCLSHPEIKIPEDGKIFSINEGNYADFPTGVKTFVEYCKTKDKESGRPYGARYIGSLIADFHRNLLKGGIFIYPPTEKTPNGKLRLLYECNPMSFIVEQAGGRSSTGKMRVLEVQPTELHQRVPLFIGSKNMVEKAMDLMGNLGEKTSL